MERHVHDERGSAIVELCIVIPIFVLLICTIIEFASLIIAYAAVDDAAYAVSHAYGVDPSLSIDSLKDTAAAGPLDKRGITIQKDEPANSTAWQYTHHFPNDPYDHTKEQHWMYSKDVTFTVTYDLQPQTVVGQMIANGHGIPITAKSACVEDKTLSPETGTKWWTG